MSAFVADSTRTSTRWVFAEPTRRISPVSRTRRSTACCRYGTSASSKHPARSFRASVKAPLTWPRTSLSNTPSPKPPAFTATNDSPDRSDTLCNHRAATSLPVPCSPQMSTLASEGPTLAISSSTGFISVPFGPAELHLRRQRRQQPVVVPRLLNVVARASSHRFDGTVNAPPAGHDNDGQVRILASDVPQQVQPLAPRRGVAGVVEVHQHAVEVTGSDRRNNGFRRIGGQHLEARVLQQNTQRFNDVRLIVGHQHAWTCARHPLLDSQGFHGRHAGSTPGRHPGSKTRRQRQCQRCQHEDHGAA